MTAIQNDYENIPVFTRNYSNLITASKSYARKSIDGVSGIVQNRERENEGFYEKKKKKKGCDLRTLESNPV